MKITVATVGARRRAGTSNPCEILLRDYIERAGQYGPCAVERHPNEAAFAARVVRASGRTPAHVILLDSTGSQMSSDSLAARIGQLRDAGTQNLVFALGPASGWTAAQRKGAHAMLSLGPLTLPHELAAVVLSEQIYRALTILAGHPYHLGH